MLTKYRQLIYMDNKPTATDPSTVYANARLYWLIQKRGVKGFLTPTHPLFSETERAKSFSKIVIFELCPDLSFIN